MEARAGTTKVNPKDRLTYVWIPPGLALATFGSLRGILVQTVRASNRSEEDLGDNVVFFSSGSPVPGLAVDQVYFFGKAAAPEVFAVSRP